MEAAWSGWPPGAVRWWPNEQSSDIPRMLKGSRFGEAIPLVEQARREAAAESTERLIEAARRIVGWNGVFANAQQEIASEPYFRDRTLVRELTGEPDATEMRWNKIRSPAAISAQFLA